jgi:hypothetical protein
MKQVSPCVEVIFVIRFSCPSCEHVFNASDKEAGAKFHCSECGQKVQVPEPPTQKKRFRSPHGLILFFGVPLLATLLFVVPVMLPFLLNRRTSPEVSEKPDEVFPDSQLAKRITESDKALGESARAILKKNCYRCHGENGTAEGAFNYILDRDRLVLRKKIKPGDADKSRLFRRTKDGEMPPEDEKVRPTADDIATLKKWIEAGAPSPSQLAPKLDFVRDAQMAALIHANLLTVPERDRRFARFFTFTHLHNAGLTEDELKTYQHGLSKLLNSLSWQRQIKEAIPVDPGKTIYRIDIRDYQWNDRVWKRILSEYPYGIVANNAAANECLEIAGGQLPYVRGDWFVATGSRPPLYHEVLQLPESERKLEEQLHIDVLENIKQERVIRAGFNSSGVSRNNRLIERHESPYGSYWRSYDFSSNTGTRNLFAHPLGPAGKDAIQADGGEIIFNLPNGLHAFVLVNDKGQRLDKAPITIVSDPRRPDRAVENGVSCMSCHVRGLLPKKDQIRAHVIKNPGAFSQVELETIKVFYPAEAALQAVFAKDNDRFRKAVEQTGSPFSVTEPITALVASYEKELDLPTAAAEAGMLPKEFSDRLGESADLNRQLGALRVSGGTVQRQVFVEAFPELVREMNLGSLNKPQ